MKRSDGETGFGLKHGVDVVPVELAAVGLGVVKDGATFGVHLLLGAGAIAAGAAVEETHDGVVVMSAGVADAIFWVVFWDVFFRQ